MVGKFYMYNNLILFNFFRMFFSPVSVNNKSCDKHYYNNRESIKNRKITHCLVPHLSTIIPPISNKRNRKKPFISSSNGIFSDEDNSLIITHTKTAWLKLRNTLPIFPLWWSFNFIEKLYNKIILLSSKIQVVLLIFSLLFLYLGKYVVIKRVVHLFIH